jgi:hypothetical protein
MSVHLKEEWPYVPLKSPRADTTVSWKEDAEPSPGGVDWMRWGVIGLLVGAAAVTVLSGIAVAALHENDTQTNAQSAPATITPAPDDVDPHLQELLREHRNAVFGS